MQQPQVGVKQNLSSLKTGVRKSKDIKLAASRPTLQGPDMGRLSLTNRKGCTRHSPSASEANLTLDSLNFTLAIEDDQVVDGPAADDLHASAARTDTVISAQPLTNVTKKAKVATTAASTVSDKHNNDSNTKTSVLQPADVFTQQHAATTPAPTTATVDEVQVLRQLVQ